MQGDFGKMQGSASREPAKKHHFSMRWITFSLTQQQGDNFAKQGDTISEAASARLPHQFVDGRALMAGLALTGLQALVAQPIEQALGFRYPSRRPNQARNRGKDSKIAGGG